MRPVLSATTNTGVSQSPPSTPPRRRFWKWCRRLLIAFVLLLAALVVFHKPLLLAVIRWAGPKAAASQNLPLSWLVEGSLWNDLRVTDVKTGGGEFHWLPRAEIGELSADYNWRSLLNKDFEHSVNRVTLHDVDADVDLRHLPPSQLKVAPAEPAVWSGPPPIVWPRTVDLKNVNAAVTLADGSRILVRGLTLQTGEGMPGIFECKEFRKEPGGPVLENLQAKVLLESRRITIQELALPQGIVLEQLVADLQGLWNTNASAGVELLTHLGAARFAVKASASGLFKPPLQVEANVQGRDLRSEELHTLGLPKNVFFEKGTLDMQAAGDPAKPAQFSAEFTLSLANLRTAGAQVDQVSMNATVKDGRADVKSVQVIRTENRLDITAEATLPQDPKAWATAPWTARLQGSLPKVTDFLDKPPPFTGKLALNATAEGQGSTPMQASGELTGDTLAFEAYKLPRLRSLFSLNGKQARLEIPPLEIGKGNNVSLTATMQMQDAMPVEASWQVRVADPMALMASTGLPAPEKPVKAIFGIQGKAAFNVQDLSAQDYSKALANVTLKLDEAVYGDDRLPKTALLARVEKGKVILDSGAVQVDAQNGIQLSGTMDIKPPFAFQAQSKIGLPQLISLNGLLKAAGASAIQGGALNSDLQAVGQLKPWLCQGNLQLTGTSVKTAAMSEAANISLNTSFEGTRADVSKLEATLGPWRVTAKGTVDDRQAKLAELKVWQNQTALLSGVVSAPFDLTKPDVIDGQPMDVAITAKDLRIHEILAAAGIKDIPAGILNADVQLKGRLETAQGKVWVELKDVKVPQGPKSFQTATLRFDTKLENRRIKNSTVLIQPPLQTLTVDADLPLDLAALAKNPQAFSNTPLRVQIKMPESDLSFLREYAPDMIRSVPAKLKIDANVSGTVGKPIVQGDVDLNVTEIAWAKPDLPSVRNVRARIEARDRVIRITDVSALLAGGRIRLGGVVDVTNGPNPKLDLRLDASEALVFRDPTTSVRANASITCQGDLQRSTVAGSVEVVRGRVFKEIDLLPVLKLPADVPPVPPDTSRSEAKITLPPVVKDWNFNIRVRTRDPVLISGNLANGAVSADALLSGTGATPQLTGGANVDRMLLKLPFSMVKITEGVITLRPDHPFDPDLDIRGESNVGSNEITLYVYGDSTNPRTRFTSSPPMSEPDIVTLLATGTTLNGSASELASEAATRAAFLFLTEFYRKTFNKKKVVREEPPKLNMTFNPSGADRSNDSVQASYDLTENWRLTGRFTQTGRMKALLGYVLRFGKAAQAMDPRTTSTMGKPTPISPMPVASPGSPPPAP